MPIELVNEANRLGLPVLFCSFNSELKGLYTGGQEPAVIINDSIRTDIPLLRCVLAEEIGHHYTSVGFGFPSPYRINQTHLEIIRGENSAWRWAATRLIPTKKLIQSVRKGITDPWDLADHFRVVEPMIHFRLEIYKRRDIYDHTCV
ncbi:ImmA/IrrE family metallo-endopeptidase [Kroppenstedtia sanguinis]|uniref:ImmA/IrrE family metallo-endopeptidase n=1 Tax=Kroppenstedtia sanguinis TaxID=1380684 RepID=A0ABW4C5Y7_9BACL